MKKLIPIVILLFFFIACGVTPLDIQVSPSKTTSATVTEASATATRRPIPTPVPSLTATEAVFPTQEVLIDAPIDGTDKLFNQLVLQSPQPVIVDFWAGWCADRKPMAATLETIAEEYAGRVIVVKMDIDRYPDRAHWCGVQALPAVDFFVNGSLAYREVGSRTEGMVRTCISDVFGVRWRGN